MEFIYGGLLPILGMLLSFGLLFLIIFVFTRARQRRLELQADLQGKLIDRFGSTPELVAFLQSPAGREFVLGVQQGPLHYTRERVISGFRRSIVLTLLGVALTALEMYDHGFLPFGLVVLCLGLGYLGATIVTMKLSRSMSYAPVPPSFASPRAPDSTSLTTTEV